MAIVSLQDVCKEYQSGNEQLLVLDRITLEVEEGTVVVVTGESGSGKSTLLNLIAGLDPPTDGTVDVDGHPVHRLYEDQLTDYRSRIVGLVFQFHYLLRDFTTLENVMLPAYMAGIPYKVAGAGAETLLGEVGLYDRLHHYPTQLSGGERQRAAVARALVNDPSIILADEPTGNLDARNSESVRSLLFSLVRDHHKTLVLVTHDAALAHAGDRHLLLSRGRLVER